VNEQDLGVKLERAIEETGKVINARPAEVKERPKLAEPKQVSEPLVSAEDMAKPFTKLNTARFRRF